MEVQFRKSVCSCLRTALREVRNLEQTQEIRLSDGMPDVGRILSGWGQVILRTKEWNPDSICLTAGMMVWVLYAPEDGSEPRCVESWIPFQMEWDLPEDTPEGEIRVQCLTRFVDARSVSARKILVRAGVGALAEAYVPMEAEYGVPEELPESVELLKLEYPLRLPKEAGEKGFLLEDELTLPPSAPEAEKLLYYTVTPEVLEQRVLSDKVVFRGNGNLHVLYASPDGSLHSWDFSLAFSQYAELRGSYSGEAELSVTAAVTGLELEKEDSGVLHLKCTLSGQYLVEDLELLEIIGDAYSPGRALTIHREDLELPAVLETRRETVAAEQQTDGTAAVDVQFLPDFPRQRRMEDGVAMELPGSFQVLSLGEDGRLQSSVNRWEGALTLRADSESRLRAVPEPLPEPQVLLGGGSLQLRQEVPLSVTTTAGQAIPMVTGLELGEELEPDSSRPSLILRRAGDRGLWDMAKESGSTVEAIRRANHLQQDPAPGQMLLIPIL